MNKKWFGLVLTVFAIGCGTETLEQTTDQDFNEEEVDVTKQAIAGTSSWVTNDSRYASAIRINIGSSSCSAVSLSKHWLLTAGHCTKGFTRKNVRVRYKNSSGNLVESYFDTARIYRHPSYKQPGHPDFAKYDLAMIHLDDAQNPGQSIYSTARILLWDGWIDWDFPWIRQVGFGSQSTASTCGTNFGIKAVASFESTWSNDRYFSTKSTATKSVCGGDSGGPAYVHVTSSSGTSYALVAGVLSNIKNGVIQTCNWPGGSGGDRKCSDVNSEIQNTRLFKHFNWIKNTAQNAGRPLTCYNYTANYKYPYTKCYSYDAWNVD